MIQPVQTVMVTAMKRSLDGTEVPLPPGKLHKPHALAPGGDPCRLTSQRSFRDIVGGIDDSPHSLPRETIQDKQSFLSTPGDIVRVNESSLNEPIGFRKEFPTSSSALAQQRRQECVMPHEFATERGAISTQKSVEQLNGLEFRQLKHGADVPLAMNRGQAWTEVAASANPLEGKGGHRNDSGITDPLVEMLRGVHSLARNPGNNGEDEGGNLGDVDAANIAKALRARAVLHVPLEERDVRSRFTPSFERNQQARSSPAGEAHVGQLGPPNLQHYSHSREQHARMAPDDCTPDTTPDPLSWRTFPATEAAQDTSNLSLPDSADDLLCGSREKQVPIGQDYQASLPPVRPIQPILRRNRSESPVVGAEADDENREAEEEGQWLGTQVWPPLHAEVGSVAAKTVGGSATERTADPGWREKCSCSVPASMECVRLHVKEADKRLRRELGQAYYTWGCAEMGEKYAETWTETEEDTFVSTVQWYPRSKNGNFWAALDKTLPLRRRPEKVSYYFNVFVLRRRAAQNRLCRVYPDVTIDSDDDEAELFEEETVTEGQYEEDELPEVGREEGVMEGECVDKSERERHRIVEETEVALETEQRQYSVSELDEEPEGEECAEGDDEVEVGKAEGIARAPFEEHVHEPTYKKDEETDMDDTDDEHPMANDHWEKHAWGSVMGRARGSHPSQNGMAQGMGEGNRHGGGDAETTAVDILHVTPEFGGHGETNDVGVWGSPLDLHAGLDEDRFISTNGVMKELFGEDAAEGWQDEEDEHAL